MRKIGLFSIFSTVAAVFCFLLSFHAVEAQAKEYVSMADNFFVIYDPSTSMDVPYKDTGMTRIEASKEIIKKSNESLKEMNWQTGLYPHWKPGLWLHGAAYGFKPYYRLQNYNKEKFAQAIEKLPTTPQGPPMLQIGLMKLEHMLGLPGQTQVFLFTTGEDSRVDGVDEPDPLTQVRKLDKLYDVCFMIISSAKGPKEKKLLSDMAAVNACSQVVDFDTVFNHPEHLFGKLYADKNSMFPNILFDFDRSFIRKGHFADLNKLGRMLQSQPTSHVVLSGFTDNIGTEAYNIGLSERRARSVANYLKRNFNIPDERILLYWYGYRNPVADNSTKEGRQKNRRVAITFRK